LTEEINNLIKDGVKVHQDPCSTCGSDTGPTAAHGPVRVNMHSRYHKWLGKESRKCAPGKVTTLSFSKEFAAVVVSTDKALAYFAAHPEMVLELLELYYKGSAFALKQVA
jgi:hypothetical protein